MNAGPVRAAAPGQLAFVYRDMAENERQNADELRRPPTALKCRR
jgi:hypothetical protein